jgi:hypothetical protein
MQAPAGEVTRNEAAPPGSLMNSRRLKNGHADPFRSLPLFPQKQIFVTADDRSALCQKQTSHV